MIFMFIAGVIGILVLGLAINAIAALSIGLASGISSIITKISKKNSSSPSYHPDFRPIGAPLPKGRMQEQQDLESLSANLSGIIQFIMCLALGIYTGMHYKSFETGLCWFLGSNFVLIYLRVQMEN